MGSLLILESPTKAGTVGKILGSDYTVVASKGHVRDLPVSLFGVDIENDFEPMYVNMRDKLSIINDLKKKAKEADCIYLASDPDREGEAIAWHLSAILDIKDKPVYRVTFNEITQKGIAEGMANPGDININLVDAYQARRVLDRVVGYKLSPFLWKKVKPNLSAGRVQSVATRLICDREEEISKFVPKEYWTITADVAKKDTGETFCVSYFGENNKKTELENEKDAKEVLDRISGLPMRIVQIKKGDKKQSPYAPFTTSTLQQDAAHKLGFKPSTTMSVAQSLYEGVNVAGRGLTGLVTYIRTDSVRISDEAVAAARDYITKKYGKSYLPSSKRVFKNKNTAQDAHEAIRPSHIDLLPDEIRSSLKDEQYKLYKLIYDRFIASQMADMVYSQTSVTLECGEDIFKTTGSIIKFNGFSAQYKATPSQDDCGTEKNNSVLPELTEGEIIDVLKYNPEQHFTQPPARYNEASLVKTLEDLGIGRPSTFASIIATIEDRGYVESVKKVLYPTEIGKVVTEILKQSFSEVVDVKFTAKVEAQLDDVAEGRFSWRSILREFYGPFEKELTQADVDIEKVKLMPKLSDEICEKCGRPMAIKKSKFGEFLACSGYPDCKFTKPIVKNVGKACPECGKMLVYKKSAKGRQFIACSGYPTCTFSSFYEPTGKKCPKCNSYLVYKKSRGNRRYIACSNQSCGYVPSAEKKKSEDSGKSEDLK